MPVTAFYCHPLRVDLANAFRRGLFRRGLFRRGLFRWGLFRWGLFRECLPFGLGGEPD